MRLNKRFLTILLIAALGGAGIYYYSEQAKNHIPELGIKKHEKGGYGLYVDDKPFIVRGVCYNPIPVGKDYEYDFFSDPGKPWITDGKLMKEAGINAVRLYRVDQNPTSVKRVISDLKNKFGIYSFVGHYLGFWDWPPANYADANFRAKMIQEVVKMVETYKDQPGNIGWILGNENNYSFDRNIREWSSPEIDAIEDPKKRWAEKARIYYSYVNELAAEVRRVDPTRPIIMGIGEIKSLEIAAEVTPNIDVIGVIAYRGAGFGNLFRSIQQTYDKPVLVIEYGADRFNAYTKEEDQNSQARFVELQWKDIERNSAIRTSKGNVIGGLLFEWTDEWWKANENLGHTWGIHDRTAQWSNSSYYYDYEAPGRMNINEEWFGIVALKQKPEELDAGIDKRVPTAAYHRLKKYWKNEIVWSGIEMSDDSDLDSESDPVTSSESGNIPKSEVTNQDSNVAKIVSLGDEEEDLLASTKSNETVVPNQAPSNFQSNIQKNSAGGYRWNYLSSENFAKGVTYNPTPIGKNFDYRLVSDPSKPWKVDGALMKSAGINAVKVAYTGKENAQALKEMIGELHKKQGIQSVLIHDLNFWNEEPVNYGDKSQQDQVINSVVEMVSLLADEEGISAWVLGSQSNQSFDMGLRSWTTPEINAIAGPEKQWAAKAKVYYEFINRLSQAVKKVDSTRPVVMGVDDVKSLDIAGKLIPNVDAVGVSTFRSNELGSVVSKVHITTNKPVILLKFGIDRFNAITSKEDQPSQAEAIKNQLQQLENYSSLHQNDGVLVGAFIHEWSDQWWKAKPSVRSSWTVQDQVAQSSNAAFVYDYIVTEPNLNVNEEWFGIVSLQPGVNSSADQRVPTLAYDVVKEAWTSTSWSANGVRNGNQDSVKEDSVTKPTAGKLPKMLINKNSSGGYTATIAGKNTWIKGVVYTPQATNAAGVADWSTGKSSWLSDGKLMKQMGVNAIRIYDVIGQEASVSPMIQGMYKEYGIRTFVGFRFPIDSTSKTVWSDELLASVQKLSDQPSIAGWIIGDGNNYGYDNPNVSDNSFVDILSKIRKIDSDRLIIAGLPSINAVNQLSAKSLTDADLIGVNGFENESLSEAAKTIQQKFGKPVIVTEFGVDRYNALKSAEAELEQARYLEQQWLDIEWNSTLRDPSGKNIGGFVYEWTDRWWAAQPANNSSKQDMVAEAVNTKFVYDYSSGQMNVNPEWFGINASSNAGQTPSNQKLAYKTLQNLWNENSLCGV